MILSLFIYLFFFSFIHFSFLIHFCSIFLHLCHLLTFFFSLTFWFQLVQLHFTISNLIPTGLQNLREEDLNHLKYWENSSRLSLCCCVNYSSMDLRFHLLEENMASPLSSLFDIIITTRRCSHHRHCHQQDNYHNQCNRCQSFMLRSTYDCASSAAQ